MQNAAFAALGLNCTYIAFRVPAGELEESMQSLRSIKIAGFNVTVPHKIAVISYVDELDPSAEKAGAINTVNNIEGIFKGYNTDMHGFIEPLHQRKVDFAGMHVLLLGAGGAARAVVAALSEEQGIVGVVISNRDHGRAAQLAAFGAGLGLRCEVASLSDAPRFAPDADLIVNATTIGMNNEPSPFDHTKIKKGCIVYDIVYRPVVTDLIENAKYAQAVVVYGYEMLLEQGAKAFEIWTGIPAPRDAMKKSLFGVYGEPS
jgi:shikimate dehydrogenase